MNSCEIVFKYVNVFRPLQWI